MFLINGSWVQCRKNALEKTPSLSPKERNFLFSVTLLIEKIASFKTYTNFPGYDLIATNAENNSSARIQVKSRYKTNWDGFIINNFDCDFVVFVALNRGYSKPKKNGDDGIKDPEFYVFPVEYVQEVRDPNNKWGKIVKSRLENLEKYKDHWDLIQNFLNGGNQ